MHYLSLEKARKKSLRLAKIEIQNIKTYGMQQKQNEVYNNKYLYQEKRSEINNLTLYLKKLEREQTKPKLSGGNEGNNKDQSENRHHKDDRKKINETKTYFLEKTKLTNFWLGYKKEREKI